ncbi:hypothetical protein AAFN86_18185 [Roseomonas sp. CAU 1739]
MPRRPVPAAILVVALAAILWFSLPAALRLMQASGWQWEIVLAAVGAHALVLGGLGWIAWLFWAARRPGDGG